MTEKIDSKTMRNRKGNEVHSKTVTVDSKVES